MASEVVHQHPGHVAADALAQQDALHRDVGRRAGQRVRRHLPAAHPQPVGEVEQRVAGVLALGDPPGHGGDRRLRVAVAEDLERPERRDRLGELLAGAVAVVVDAPVALATQPDEVVVLGDDRPGRAGEVDLEHRHVAAEVVHVEDQVVGQLGGVPPDHPADAQRRQPELVAGAADRLHPRQPEVPLEVGRAERREEAAAGRVDVDVDVQPGLRLQPVERVGDLLHRLVAAGVGDPQGRHHEDGVLVDPLEHVLGRHHVLAVRHGDLAHLDVPVARELVPHDLNRPADHVGPVGRLALGAALGPPPPLRGHAAEHAGLRRADRGGADGVGRLGRVPQVGHHVHAAPLDLRGLRVLVLVDHVLVDGEVHQRGGPAAPPRSGRTSPGSAGCCRRAASRRRPAGRRSRPGTPRRGSVYFGSGAGQGTPTEDGVVDAVADLVTLMKGHACDLATRRRER